MLNQKSNDSTNNTRFQGNSNKIIGTWYPSHECRAMC